jgi:nicotinate-nucleotide pyrophosphorylase (carboxylating)
MDAVRAIVRRALEEDVAWGVVTTDNSVPADQRSRARLLVKQDGVLCGVASQTAKYLEARTSGGPVKARLLDTRKTTPGLRVLEKYAVRVGGGANHRFNLADAVLLKDNHLAALASRGLDLADAIRTIKQRVPHTMKVEVEITSLEQVDAVLAGGADIVLLDNMTNDAMREAVRRIGGRALTECSGNVTLDTVRARAETGVDLISSGALTHSAKALDISLEIDID